jgi:hypothetical protein
MKKKLYFFIYLIYLAGSIYFVVQTNIEINNEIQNWKRP